MATRDSIPVLDFQPVLDAKDLSRCPPILELHNAFAKVGFVFLKNHGIQLKLVNKAFKVSQDFFTLPLSIKRKYLRIATGEKETGNSGYVEMEQESVNPEKPGDLKEAFNICEVDSRTFPDEDLPEFRVVLMELYRSAIACSKKVLEAMGNALKLEDPLYFVKRHQYSGTKDSFTTARVLHYPPLPSSIEIKPGQLRCGEHVDYGSITLLFQDPNGGLQVKTCDGGYIDVPYIEDAVLVNLGALMQNWTSDRYMATPHRVLLPGESTNRTRQSIAIFIHPDHKALIDCVDGSNKYPPVLAYDDTYQRLYKSYKI